MNLTRSSITAMGQIRRNGSFCDSFGNKEMSDYIKYAEYEAEEKDPDCGYFPADKPIFRLYSRRQAHIIKGTLPSTETNISKNELIYILDKATDHDDEARAYVISSARGDRNKLFILVIFY